MVLAVTGKPFSSILAASRAKPTCRSTTQANLPLQRNYGWWNLKCYEVNDRLRTNQMFKISARCAMSKAIVNDCTTEIELLVSGAVSTVKFSSASRSSNTTKSLSRSCSLKRATLHLCSMTCMVCGTSSARGGHDRHRKLARGGSD